MRAENIIKYSKQTKYLFLLFNRYLLNQDCKERKFSCVFLNNSSRDTSYTCHSLVLETYKKNKKEGTDKKTKNIIYRTLYNTNQYNL